MTKILILSNSLLYDKTLVDSIKSDIIQYNENSYPDISNIDSITHLSFIYHNRKNEVLQMLPFYEEKNSSLNYNFFTKKVIDLINLAKTKTPQGTQLIVDLITCDLNSTDFVEQMALMETEMNIDIRYSVDQTGNNPQGNWILESDNVNIKDIYFTENIDNWSDTLLYSYQDYIQNNHYLKFTYSGGVTSFQNKTLYYLKEESKFLELDNNKKLVTIQESPGRIIHSRRTFNIALDCGLETTFNANTVAYLDMPNQRAGIGLYADGTIDVVGRLRDGGYTSYDGFTTPYPTFNDIKSIVNQNTIIRLELLETGGFIVMCSNGKVFCWGSYFEGTFQDTVNGTLGNNYNDGITNCIDIQTRETYCIILKNDGTVLSRGATAPSSVTDTNDVNFVQCVAIYTNGKAYAVLRTDGSIISWGNASDGGDSSSIPALSTDIGFQPFTVIAPMNTGFVGLRDNGTVVGWGSGMANTPSSITTATHIYSVMDCVAVKYTYTDAFSNNNINLIATGVFPNISLADGQNLINFDVNPNTKIICNIYDYNNSTYRIVEVNSGSTTSYYDRTTNNSIIGYADTKVYSIGSSSIIFTPNVSSNQLQGGGITWGSGLPDIGTTVLTEYYYNTNQGIAKDSNNNIIAVAGTGQYSPNYSGIYAGDTVLFTENCINLIKMYTGSLFYVALVNNLRLNISNTEGIAFSPIYKYSSYNEWLTNVVYEAVGTNVITSVTYANSPKYYSNVAFVENTPVSIANVPNEFTLTATKSGTNYTYSLTPSGLSSIDKTITNDTSLPAILGPFEVNGESYTVTIYAIGSTIFDIGNQVIACLTDTCNILTPSGYKNVSGLKEGDMVITSTNEIVPIVKLFKSSCYNKPRLIKANQYGHNLPIIDTYISDYHAYLVNKQWKIPAKEQLPKEWHSNEVTYYHVQLPDYYKDHLIVNGLATESWDGFFPLDERPYQWKLAKHGGFIKKLN